MIDRHVSRMKGGRDGDKLRKIFSMCEIVCTTSHQTSLLISTFINIYNRTVSMCIYVPCLRSTQPRRRSCRAAPGSLRVCVCDVCIYRCDILYV